MTSKKGYTMRLLKRCIHVMLFVSFMHNTPIVAQYPTVFFSPRDNLEKKLIELIDTTSNSIHAAIYQFTSIKIARALIRAKKRNVHIKLIADQVSIRNNNNKIEYLKRHGIEVCVFAPPQSRPPLMHNKFALFKINNQQSVIWTGSFNWTHSANYHHQENALILESNSLYRRYSQHFEEIRRQCATGRYETRKKEKSMKPANDTENPQRLHFQVTTDLLAGFKRKMRVLFSHQN